MKARSKKLLFRSLISLALIVIVFLKVDLDSLMQVFLSANLALFLLAGLFFWVQQVLTALSWGILLRAKKNDLPFRNVLGAHIMGSFFGTFMPSSLGIDIARVYCLPKRLVRRVDAFSSMFVCRVIGLLLLLLFAFGVSIPISQLEHDSKILWLVLGTFSVFLLALGFLFNGHVTRWVGKLLDHIHLKGVKENLRQVYLSILEYSQLRTAVIQVGLLTLGFQIIGIIFVYVLGLSLDISVPLSYYFIYIPIISVITLIPISVAGIGVREGSFVYFFSQVGASKPEALSMSLLLFLQTLLLALIGGIIYWASGDSETKRIISERPPMNP